MMKRQLTNPKKMAEKKLFKEPHDVMWLWTSVPHLHVILTSLCNHHYHNRETVCPHHSEFNVCLDFPAALGLNIVSVHFPPKNKTKIPVNAAPFERLISTSRFKEVPTSFTADGDINIPNDDYEWDTSDSIRWRPTFKGAVWRSSLFRLLYSVSSDSWSVQCERENRFIGKVINKRINCASTW